MNKLKNQVGEEESAVNLLSTKMPKPVSRGLECRTRKEPCSSTVLTTIKNESGKRAAIVKAAMAMFDE
jgi:hypothetical protein